MSNSKSYSIAMVAACPFPANHGSAPSIREMSDTLSDMGHNVHIVTYPTGQEDIRVRRARVHRLAPFRAETNAKVGPSTEKFVWDFKLLQLLCKVIREEQIDIIHAHNYEGALIGIWAKWLTRRPLLYNAVNLMSDELAELQVHSAGFCGERSRAYFGLVHADLSRSHHRGFAGVTRLVRRARRAGARKVDMVPAEI